MHRPDTLFPQLLDLSRAEKLDAAVDLVFDTVDDMLLEGRIEEVDRLLERIPVNDLAPAILVGFLTITAPARGALGARAALVGRVRARLGEGTTAEELAKVMQGLE